MQRSLFSNWNFLIGSNLLAIIGLKNVTVNYVKKFPNKFPESKLALKKYARSAILQKPFVYFFEKYLVRKYKKITRLINFVF